MTTLALAKLVVADLGTLGDVARAIGVRPNVVGNWEARWPDFPAPLGTIGKSTVYHLPTVLTYLEAR